MSEEMKTNQTEQAPLSRFLRHQQAALEETGKALASLLPREFRDHTGRAIDEGVAGWKALIDGVRVEVERSLDRMANFGKPGEGAEGHGKVKVDVE